MKKENQSVVVIGCGVNYGKSFAHKKILEVLGREGFNVIASLQKNKRLLFDIDSFKDFSLTPVNGREAGEELRKCVLGLSATPIRITAEEAVNSLFPDKKEPKKIKFHNNLRSQLSTGGIKWVK